MTDSRPPPRWTAPAHPLWTGLLLGCAVANLVPLWSAAHLPFTDLPQHVAAIGTLRHWFDPAWRCQEYFTLALRQTQYLLYYLAGAVLAFPFGTAERANLVLLSAIALAFPFSLRSLLRALGADERLALFSPPLFWSQALLIGFFNYLAALPLVLWGLALAVRLRERPGRRDLAGLAALSVALFYLHLSAFLFFAPCAAAAAVLLPTPAPAREWPRRLAWLLPVAILSVFWLATSPVAHPELVGWSGGLRLAWEPPDLALRNLPAALLDIWRGQADTWVLLSLLGAAALLSWPRARDAEDAGSAWHRGLAAVWVAFAGVLYFAFPVSIGWMWQLNERYALLAALVAPALLRPARGLRGAVPLLLVAATALCSAGNATRVVRAFDEEVGPFDEVLAKAEPGKRLIGIAYEQNSAYAKFSPFLHFHAYYRARKGGVSSFSFAELPQSPLRYRAGAAPPRKPEHWEWFADSFNNQTDGPYYDYVLVHGFGERFRRLPGPSWGIRAQAGRWTLYEKKPGS